MLGSAVIGTVIALKIPESIAPIKIDWREEYLRCANDFTYWLNMYLEVHKVPVRAILTNTNNV